MVSSLVEELRGYGRRMKKNKSLNETLKESLVKEESKNKKLSNNLGAATEELGKISSENQELKEQLE